MNEWKAIAKCISIRESYPNQISIGKVYYLKDRYTEDDGNEYVEVYTDSKYTKCIGRILLSHFDIIASSDTIYVFKSVHGNLSMNVMTYNVPEIVDNFFKFMHIWGDTGNLQGNGSIMYEVGCTDFIKSEAFEYMMLHNNMYIHKDY